MSETIELYLLTKAELRERRQPADWKDPEGITAVPEHHRPFLIDNPLSHNDDDPVRAYVLIDKQVGGRLGMLVGEVTVEGQPLPVLWAFDLFVSTAFRGRGLATRLIRCWQDAHHTAVGMHVNLESVGIYRKLGWTEFRTPNLYQIRASRKFLEGLLPLSAAGALLAPLVDAGLALRRGMGRLAGGRSRSGLIARRVDRMPSQLDAALRRRRDGVATHRSAAWVNWGLRATELLDGVDCRLYLVDDRQGETVGYFILHLRTMPRMRGRFEDVPVASIRDWDIFDERRADLAALLGLAATESREWGAAAILATVPDPSAEGVLRRLGYRSMRPLYTLFHAVPPSPLAQERYKDPSVWRYSTADDDGLLI